MNFLNDDEMFFYDNLKQEQERNIMHDCICIMAKGYAEAYLIRNKHNEKITDVGTFFAHNENLQYVRCSTNNDRHIYIEIDLNTNKIHLINEKRHKTVLS